MDIILTINLEGDLMDDRGNIITRSFGAMSYKYKTLQEHENGLKAKMDTTGPVKLRSLHLDDVTALREVGFTAAETRSESDWIWEGLAKWPTT